MGGATGPFTVGMEYRDRHRRLKVIRVGGPSIWVEHLDGDPPGRVENEPLKFRRPSEGISSRATEQRSEPSARELMKSSVSESDDKIVPRLSQR